MISYSSVHGNVLKGRDSIYFNGSIMIIDFIGEFTIHTSCKTSISKHHNFRKVNKH